MEKNYNTKDALGNEIIIGDEYGYSTDSNGITQSVVGIATRFTPSGKCTLKVISALRAYSNSEPDEVEFDRKSVSVKPMKLFPVSRSNKSEKQGEVLKHFDNLKLNIDTHEEEEKSDYQRFLD